MTLTPEFLQERITATETAIAAYEDAVLAIGTEGVESYILDTGQSRQNVTKIDLASMQRTLDSLYNRLATLQARLNGANIMVIPEW
jgi:vacuolar-type H+-ATPase subunit D/Vma8